MPTVGPRWDTLNCDEAAAESLAAALKISPVVAKLLCQRGLSDPELADRFLNPSLDHLHDPMRLADMGVAVDRIMAALERQEKIAIHGDYDVDGVTSTVILRRALELLGGKVIRDENLPGRPVIEVNFRAPPRFSGSLPTRWRWC